MDPSPEHHAAPVPLVATTVKGDWRASERRVAAADLDEAVTADANTGKQGLGTPGEATRAGGTETPETGIDSRFDSDRGTPAAPSGVVSGNGRGAGRTAKDVTGSSALPVRKPSIDDVHE